jgi:hypothetical protein
VAIGVLLALGVSKTVDEAEKFIQSIRPEVEVHPVLKDELRKIFPGT